MQNVVPNEMLGSKKGKQKIVLNTASLSAGVYFYIVELNKRGRFLNLVFSRGNLIYGSPLLRLWLPKFWFLLCRRQVCSLPTQIMN